jgi:hypothetical protein
MPYERQKVGGRLRISNRTAQAQSVPIKLRRFEQVMCRFRRPLLRFSKKESKGNARAIPEANLESIQEPM